MNNPLPPGPNPYSAQSNPYAPPQPYPHGAYAPPGADAPPGVPPVAPLSVALYSPNHVALATFLGTPLAGVVLLALNEDRIGRRGAAVKTMLLGVVGTVLLLGIAMAVPDTFPAYPFTLASLVTLRTVAQHRHGALVTQHYGAGGKKASGWAAVGISLLTTLIVFVPLVVILVLVGVVRGE